jgi:hypothetical protein
MGVDDILMAIIIGGILLSGIYLRAQYALRRSLRTAELRRELGLRELYGTRSKIPDPPKSAAALLRNSLPVRVRFAYRSPIPECTAANTCRFGRTASGAPGLTPGARSSFGE